MIQIKAIRGAGDKEKPEPIVSSLISNLSVALERGRVELDIASAWSPVTLNIIFDGTVAVGHIVEVFDRLLGAAWRGVVTGVQHGIDTNGSLITVLNILREKCDESC